MRIEARILERNKNVLGQYFTPSHIANLMVGMIDSNLEAKVLEPSAGEGIFLNKLHEYGFKDCIGIEIDKALVSHNHFPIINKSFLAWDTADKFDVIIGNPPYIRWKDLEQALKDELKALPAWNVYFNSLSDYLISFIHRSIELLNDNGELIFVTPSFWLHTQHSFKLRNWILENGYISDLVTFNEANVFKGVSSSIVIFKFVKSKKSQENINHFKYIGSRTIPQNNLFLKNEELFEQNLIPNFKTNSNWTIATEDIQIRLNSFEEICSMVDPLKLQIGAEVKRLGDIVHIANGMVSGLDKAFKIEDALASKLNENELHSTLKVIKAFLLNEVWTDRYVYYINIPKGLTEIQVAKNYPNFYSQLLQYRDKLEARYSYDRYIPFWEWVFRRSEKFLSNGEPKAFVPSKERLTSTPIIRFSMVPSDCYATQDVTAFGILDGVQESLEYVVAFLSLPEVTDWFKYRGLMKGGVAEFSEKPLASIPFRGIDWSNPEEVALHTEITQIFHKLKSDSAGDRRLQIEKMQTKCRSLLKLELLR
jgi:adenine-specific DNA-methyltransferase